MEKGNLVPTSEERGPRLEGCWEAVSMELGTLHLCPRIQSSSRVGDFGTVSVRELDRLCSHRDLGLT